MIGFCKMIYRSLNKELASKFHFVFLLVSFADSLQKYVEHETELSFYNQQAYDAFKANPEIKWV